MRKALLLALTLSTTLISGSVLAEDDCPGAPRKTGSRVPYTGSVVPFPAFAAAPQTPAPAEVRVPGAPTQTRVVARGNHASVARSLFQG